MQLHDLTGVVDRQAPLSRAPLQVRDHWSAKLEAACQALARATRDQMSSARVSQRGCGVADERYLLGALAARLASEFGLTATIRPVGRRLCVVFEKSELSSF